MLVSAGNVKRDRILRIKEERRAVNEHVDEADIAEHLPEQEVNMYSGPEALSPMKLWTYFHILSSSLTLLTPFFSCLSPYAIVEDITRE